MPEAIAACPTPSSNAFMTAGPKEIDRLSDAYVWRARTIPRGANISVNLALKNVTFLDGVVDRRESSHIQVTFPASRTWTIDKNNDPLPERFVAQLVAISGRPLPVVKAVLYYGAAAAPTKTLRLIE